MLVKQVINAILLNTAINHRFWIIQEGVITPRYFGELKGASYINACLDEMLEDEPEFFSTENLQDYTIDKFEYLYGDAFRNTNDAERYEYQKELTSVLTQDGFTQQVLSCKTVDDLHDLLKNTQAFSDPYKKKTLLVAKLLNEALEDFYLELPYPPIDYHLISMAVKLGAVSVSSDFLEKFVALSPIPYELAKPVIEKTITFYKEQMDRHDMTADDIDGLYWSYSRNYCQVKTDCYDCEFVDECKAYQTNNKPVQDGFAYIDTRYF